MVAGICGTLSGSELSKALGKRTRKAEALVCSIGMLCGTPFLFLALVVAQYKNLYLAWVSMCTHKTLYHLLLYIYIYYIYGENCNSLLYVFDYSIYPELKIPAPHFPIRMSTHSALDRTSCL